MKWLIILEGILVCFFLLLLVRAGMCRQRGRKLCQKTAKNVMLMSRHDVVAAEGEWKYPPFSGQIAENCIWGRGTVDTKTPLFAEFSALEELLKDGWNPPCNVYLVSSHNEEIAGDGVPKVLSWLQDKKITFDWILDEGGAVIDAPMSGINCKCAMLAVHEKGRYTVRIKALQQAGHSSLAKQVKTPAARMAGPITEIEKKICGALAGF